MTSSIARSAPRLFSPTLCYSKARQTRCIARAARPVTSFQPPQRRMFATPAGEQPHIRLGTEGKPVGFRQEDKNANSPQAPNFTAKTTHGEINFHEFIGNSWTILFSHPADFTPVCTTELGAFAKMKDEFEKRGVKMIGISANDADSHMRWIDDINDISKTNLQFPIIADPERKVSYLYDMLDAQDLTNIDQKGIAFTIRSVFIIDPTKKVRLTMVIRSYWYSMVVHKLMRLQMYPASCGRNTSEVLRVIDALQTGDKKGVTTPIDWNVGDDVIVPPTVSTEDARKKFTDVREIRPYLRFTNVGSS